MADYTANMNAIMNGHLGLPGGNDPKDSYHPQGRTDLTDTLDIRDALSHAIAGGYTNFSDNDIKANYAKIAQLIGPQKAQNLFIQAFEYNKRPGAKEKSKEERLQNFYDIGSSDPDTKAVLSRIKNSSSDPIEGYRNSVNEGVRLLNGKETRKSRDVDVAKIQYDVNSKIKSQQ